MPTILESKFKDKWNSQILFLKWEVDESNIANLKENINNFLHWNKDNLILNIKELTYINSMVIWWLASCISEFELAWKHFAFTEANEDIFDILNLVWLTEVIDTYDTDEEALLSFK
jgi:anti-anti-sigma regulatory factor